MDSYICVDGQRIPLSDETAKNLKKQFLQVIYGKGDRFLKEGEEYILAQVNASRVGFIKLSNGSWWTCPVKVKNTSHLSEQEFLQCCGSRTFTKV